MIGRLSIFRHKRKVTAKRILANWANYMASAALLDGAIMVKDDILYVKDNILKTRKGIRT